EILKDHCPVWPWCINTHAINADLALIERNETCYDLQDRRLAATTGPKQADKFPRVHHQFQAVKRDERRLLILTRIQLPAVVQFNHSTTICPPQGVARRSSDRKICIKASAPIGRTSTVAYRFADQN